MIDTKHLAVSGCSYMGKMALYAGAFDERIALSAPVAEGMAFRFSGKEMGGGWARALRRLSIRTPIGLARVSQSSKAGRNAFHATSIGLRP